MVLCKHTDYSNTADVSSFTPIQQPNPTQLPSIHIFSTNTIEKYKPQYLQFINMVRSSSAAPLPGNFFCMWKQTDKFPMVEVE